jgi:hypothetical protein
MKLRKRMKKIIFSLIIMSLVTLPFHAQKKQQESGLKREVTLYNPYKPSLNDVVKKSFLPDMTDTSSVRPEFHYDIHPDPFMPSYAFSTIKPATLLPEPLPKLYKSYVNLGFGNYLTPLAEISITNERSKKGAIGIDLRHFSTNGKVELQNHKKAFAGYMDNDASIYGKKYFQNNIFSASVDFSQKTRYAYGYDPIFRKYSPDKKNIRLNYYNTGITLGLATADLDSSNLAYDFDINYNFFYNTSALYQNRFGINGLMAKAYKSFYVGSGIEFDYYSFSDSSDTDPRFIVAISPFITKRSNEWNVKLGLQLFIDRGVEESAKLHVYPDVNFSFNIVPSYATFFAQLSGKMVKNEPFNVIRENPFFFPDRTLFNLPNTDHALIVKGGLSGNTGLEGNYQLSASYSIVNDLLMFTNDVAIINYFPFDSIRKGNFFKPLTENANILNIHGEIGGKITDFISFNASGNYYRYTLAKNDTAWNKPAWDVTVGLKYNLRNKIVAGAEIEAIGKRWELVTTEYINLGRPVFSKKAFPVSSHFNINLSVEYKYTKILSFWMKFNNISFNKYYEWAFYPSQRFIGLIGFTYSL